MSIYLISSQAIKIFKDLLLIGHGVLSQTCATVCAKATSSKKLASIGCVELRNSPGIFYPLFLVSTTAWMTFGQQSFRGCFDFLLNFETAILSMYLLWIMSIIGFLRTLRQYLEDDPLNLRPHRKSVKKKVIVKMSKKQRHKDKVDLCDWRTQESDRQARLLQLRRSGEHRMNGKNKRKRTLEHKSLIQEKRRRRRDGEEDNVRCFLYQAILFGLLWFRKPPKEPEKPAINDMFRDLRHDDDGWASKPAFNPPIAKYIHMCNFSTAWDETCKACPDLLSLIGVDKKNDLIDFGKKPASRLQELTFVANGVTYDLTTITSVSAKMEDMFEFRSQQTYVMSDEKSVIFDTGASISVTSDRSEFSSLDTSENAIRNISVQGLASSPVVKGVGTVRWIVYTDQGGRREIETKCLWIPEANHRLLSVIRYIHDINDNCCELRIRSRLMTFRFPQKQGGGQLTFGNHERVPKVVINNTEAKAIIQHKAFPSSVVAPANINLSATQKALLKFHFCLGHWNMSWIQSLLRHGVLECPPGVSKITSKEAICSCGACQFAKQTKKPDGAKTHGIRPEKKGALIKNQLRVGGTVFTDQFVSSVPGRLLHSFGKEKEHEMQTGGTIFIDAASTFMHVDTQVSLGAAETIRSKNKLEREAMRHGIKIAGYRGDNGVYRSAEFMADCDKKNQALDFSGVGAHHHNGTAERAIRTISTCARAMMIHAMIHNPNEVNLDLWPFAVKYAVYLWNKMPKEDGGKSPEEVFYSVISDHQQLREAKVFGCPAYVLDPRLQDGKKIPKWSPRSRLGQFLGRSEVHAGTVGLIRNLRTGKITPQYNVVYDNHFTTVSAETHEDNVPVPEGFDRLFEFSREYLIDDEDDVVVRPPASTSTEESQPTKRVSFDLDRDSSQVSEGDDAVTSFPEGDDAVTSFPEGDENETIEDPDAFFDSVDVEDNFDVDSEVDDVIDGVDDPPPYSSQYPTRSRNAPTRFSEEYKKYYGANAYLVYLFSEDEDDRMKGIRNEHEKFIQCSDLQQGHSAMTQQYDMLSLLEQDDYDEELVYSIHPLAFAARANAEDTPRYDEAMHSPDAEGFRAAINLEMDQLQEKDVWTLVPREKAISEGAKIIDTVWALRRKRYPDGRVKKLKARLCARGFMQEQGVDYDDTYSPVVAWSTVRLLLILSILQNYKTKQIDFTLAFVHAPLDPGTYVEMPRGFEFDGMIMELNKNLYGLCNAPANFFYHLKGELEKRGFEACKESEPCLFINKTTGCMMLVYVDDCILFHKREDVIDDVIHSLNNPTGSQSGFDVGVEEDYAGFLGIDIKRHDDGSIELIQTGLIDRFLDAVELTGGTINTRLEPAHKEPLGKDENGPPRRENWSYPSAIGMLLYLSSNSRPDISFAVSQCARFNHCPKLVHEIAIKRIARYLKGTRDKGLILKPDSALSLEMYADADFAGLWSTEDPDDPICVRSRTGCVITLGGVPITWTSKLQTEIAVSTMHAEYIALSMSLRELLPISRLLNEICDELSINRDESTKICRVYEDNEGAMKLANSMLPKITPQSKHFAVKYHWFREKLDEFGYEILPVRTTKQKADMFTKGLTRTEFREKRKMVLGW